MSDPTITLGTIIFTFADGSVESVEITKDASLDENSMPGSDSSAALVLDFNGVKKHITLNGYLYDNGSSRTSSGTAVTTIEDQVNWLAALCNGSQTGVIFNSSYQTDKTVYVRSVHFTEKQGNPLRLEFRLELVEGL